MKRSFPFLLVCFILTWVLLGCTTTTTMLSGPAADPSLSFEQKMTAYDIPKVSITQPVVYYNGLDWRERATELIENAKDYVIISSFLASSSEELSNFYATIERKAKEGVRIYFVMDGTASYDMTESRFHLIPLDFLRDSGVHLLEFSPMSAARVVSGLDLMFRDHRKYLIVDGRDLAIGGMNFNFISMGAEGDERQRDSMYEFASPSFCKEFLDSFVPWWNSQTWDTMKREDFAIDETFGETEEHLDAWFVNQYPKEKKMSGAYGALLDESRHSVKILPYLPFVDKPVLEVLKKAEARGVDISIILPFDRRVNNRVGSQYMAKYLLDSGVDLRNEISSEVSQQFLHEKLMIVDSRYVMVGSMNFNYRTMNLAHDIALIIDSPSFASQLEKHYQGIYDQTTPVTKKEVKAWHTWYNWPDYIMGFYGG
ncbi:phosphatidylserine/phosphatidylglycerophosphate/cardiolipin synthase family protein [uncultured Sphaerochaeta sp.]|uniref:phospholipase D-like domain-containing protein n=1 Tax=uncultured Sphaerochaeta sp. TaxID=886478 RepID=UPI002A0A779D|nr:phosphatidylserine/phosphatidylglycerophosphate/cardiolipin synthase family protein [uncultured Sphaerochaeta sp.]